MLERSVSTEVALLHKRVGKVQDLVIDQEGSQVLGVLVDEKGWFSGAHVVRWPAVLSVGDDTLIIDSKTSVVKASKSRK